MPIGRCSERQGYSSRVTSCDGWISSTHQMPRFGATARTTSKGGVEEVDDGTTGTGMQCTSQRVVTGGGPESAEIVDHGGRPAVAHGEGGLTDHRTGQSVSLAGRAPARAQAWSGMLITCAGRAGFAGRRKKTTSTNAAGLTNDARHTRLARTPVSFWVG